MKFLLHSSEATFEPVSKKWVFRLDKRISNPTQIVLSKATFTCTSDTAPFPDVVYMRSDALHRMISTKHTVELKTNNHEDASNVIAVLTETHTRGRYRIVGSRVFAVQPNHSARNIDIYFTSGTTILEGTCGSGAGQGSSSGVTDADVAAITNLLLWFPMTETTLLSSAYANTPNIGDNARYIYPGPGADSTMVFNGYQDFQVSALGLGRGISSQASWQYAIDSSMPNYWQNELFTVVFSMKMPSSLAATHKVFDFYSVRVELQSPGVLYLGDGFGSSFTSTNLAFIPTKDYLITIVRKYNNSLSVHEFGSQAENLETNVITVGNDTPKGRDVTTPSHNWNLSDASQHFLAKTGILGPLIGFPGNDATFTAQAQNWIRTKYDGGETTSGEEQSSTCEDATFFAELDIAVK